MFNLTSFAATSYSATRNGQGLDREDPMDSAETRFGTQRQQLMRALFPDGLPTLWCPALTHFTDDGAIDQPRMRAHLRFMHPWVRGFLMPGSTGEGWEMSDAEVRALLDFMIDEIRRVGGHLLIGMLKTDVRDVIEGVKTTVAWLKRRTGSDDALESLIKSSVCGFTICPPSGKDLNQEEIAAALESVLSLGLPISLYQLPQVTQNEMSPETVTALSARFANFYLFKDTSGIDRVAASGFRNAFLVRGAEGDYASHLTLGGGNYDGFLLSTANCFGRQLSAMIDRLRGGNWSEAQLLSKTLTDICAEVFDPAAKVGYGNAFSNANKAMDHFFAHGPDAARLAPPRLHSGKRLPQQLIVAAAAALEGHGLMPERGYLASASGPERMS
jgi:dihydrodipicolinate synthase/N-acetylneuraminate lyase